METVLQVLLVTCAVPAWLLVLYWLFIEPWKLRRRHFESHGRTRLPERDSDRKRWDAIAERAEYERRQRQKAA
jgi:hypothetical protein